MKKVLITIFLLSVFVFVSCDSGTKKDTDKDSGTLDGDVITDVEITDDDSSATDHDSPVTDSSDEVITELDDDSPLTDDDENPFTDNDSSVSADADATADTPDDDEIPDDAFIPEEYTVDGFVQKGPFIKDSEIQITELDNNFEMIPSTSFTTKTIDDIGNFNIKRKFSSRYIEIKASGFYYDEVAGAVSSTQITNYVFVDLKANNSKISINILTTLARKRIQYLMKHGKNFNEARTQSETEILEIFGIFGETAANFQDMDILKAGNSNAMLLAISARLQGNNTPGDLSSLTAGIIYEIETKGKLDDSTIKTKIEDGGKYIGSKLNEIRSNIESHFGSKTTVEVPNFEDYCDDDGNGIINKWDFDLDFGEKEKAERNTVYASEENTVTVNPATTAVAKTTLGTVVINGTDTGLNESSINNGDKLSVKVTSSNVFETTVKADITVEFTVNEGNVDDWTVSGSYSVTTGECDYDEIQIADNVCGDGTGTSEQKCIKGDWVNQGDCTRVFNCSPKPEENSVWNSVDKYTQTWNGSEWSPVDSSTVHNITASTIECRFRCKANFPWDGSKCSACAGSFPNWHKDECWSDKSPNTMNWSNAISYCEGLGGRLPNIQELRMLIKECPQNEYPKPDGQDPWCPTKDPEVLSYTFVCPGCSSDTSGKYSIFGDADLFWSSSSVYVYTNDAWYVYFLKGSVNNGDKISNGYVRCVR